MNQAPIDKWRLYSVVNGLYMKEIQWGIQTAHGVSTVMSKVFDQLLMQLTRPLNEQDQHVQKRMMDMYLKLQEWATRCPTIIVCDGVNVAGLKAAWEIFEFYADAFDLPTAKFHEDQDSLGGVITNACVLVPSNFFNAKPIKNTLTGEVDSYELEDGEIVKLGGDGQNGWKFTLVNYLKQLRLAR